MSAHDKNRWLLDRFRTTDILLTSLLNSFSTRNKESIAVGRFRNGIHQNELHQSSITTWTLFNTGCWQGCRKFEAFKINQFKWSNSTAYHLLYHPTSEKLAFASSAPNLLRNLSDPRVAVWRRALLLSLHVQHLQHAEYVQHVQHVAWVKFQGLTLRQLRDLTL